MNISVFDIFKIGVGPSSSHTLGPWKAALKWINELKSKDKINEVLGIKVELFGSLSLTGKGHATDIAVALGLEGNSPETMIIDNIDTILTNIKKTKTIVLNNEIEVPFDFNQDIVFKKEFLPFHANALTFTAILNSETIRATYYSIGGGFVVQDDDKDDPSYNSFPFKFKKATELLQYCKGLNVPISQIVLKNEKSFRSEFEIDYELQRIWNTMFESVYRGCHTEGYLPGGLNVRRRAFDMYQSLKGVENYNSLDEWLETIRNTEVKFRQILKWVSCFAISVNEVNASLGRIVTAPTNGSAGVIPAVLMYYLAIENHNAGFEEIKKFLLVASEIAGFFKKGATISAAMGGCQAEIGVSSSMAAAGLCELMGGAPEQVLIAAEIAMEHHLGLTCDPIGGLVQIPCIERNTMGAIKAIQAAELALDTNPNNVKVPLDMVVNTMWETAKDMNYKYKETSQGGLAVGVSLSDC